MNMDSRIVFMGVLVLVLGIVFIGVSSVSIERGGYWDHGDGTAQRDSDSSTIFFGKDDRWTIENISYLLWTIGTNQSTSLPPDNLHVSLYNPSGTMVTQVTYGDLKQLPTGLPVPNPGLNTIKIEDIGASQTVSATYVRLVYKSETVSPYKDLFLVGILILLGGAAATVYGVVKLHPLRKKTRRKSA